MRHALVFLVILGCSASPGVPDAPSSELDAAIADAPVGRDATAVPDAPVAADAGLDLRAALETAGFDVSTGAVELVDLSSCCAAGSSCSGNNPTSPYGIVYLPRAPGQTVPNEDERPDGLAGNWRLRADEAVVLVGVTPPAVAYWGWTPYLFSRERPGGGRAPVFASLSETMNVATQPVDAEPGAPRFGAPFAIVWTSDATTDAGVRAALAAAGVAARGTGTMPLDSSVVRFGLDAPDDTLGILLRTALFEDDAAGAAWLADIPVRALRVTPRSVLAADPLPPPPSRARDLSRSEAALEPAVDRLEAAIRASVPGRTIRDVMVSTGEPDPMQCIDMLTFCAGDNRDTVYPASALFRLEPGDSLYVLGVDHEATGKATYANASIYAIDHLVGLESVTSRAWVGTAEAFLPGDADADELFVWRFARDCGGDPACTVITTDACPDGAPTTALLNVTFRAYLEPTTSTRPDASMLVRERALLVQAP